MLEQEALAFITEQRRACEESIAQRVQLLSACLVADGPVSSPSAAAAASLRKGSSTSPLPPGGHRSAPPPPRSSSPTSRALFSTSTAAGTIRPLAAVATSPAAGQPYFNISSTLQSPAAAMGPVSQPNGSAYYEDESSNEDADYGRPAFFASASPARRSPTAVGTNRGLAFSLPLISRPSAAAGTMVYTIRPASPAVITSSLVRGGSGGTGGRYASPSLSPRGAAGAPPLGFASSAGGGGRYSSPSPPRSTIVPSLGSTGGARIGVGGSGRYSSPSSPRGSVSFSATAPAVPGSVSRGVSMSAAGRPGSASRVSRLREQFPLFSSPQQQSSRCGREEGEGGRKVPQTALQPDASARVQVNQIS